MVVSRAYWLLGAGIGVAALGMGLALVQRPTVLPTREPLTARTARSAEVPSQASVITISSSEVAVRGKVVERLGRDQQFALQKEGRADFIKALVEALRPELAPGGDVTVSVAGDVAYLSVARVMLALMDLGHESALLTLSAGPTRIVLAREIHLQGESGLLVLMATLGVSIKGPGGNIAPGCQDIGPGLAIPRVEGKLASGALRECVARLVHVDSRLGRAYLAANPDTPFSEIAETAEALAAGGAPLIGLRLGG